MEKWVGAGVVRMDGMGWDGDALLAIPNCIGLLERRWMGEGNI